ncbi:MAG: TonB-dependent receptor [Granulicella sp.]
MKRLSVAAVMVISMFVPIVKCAAQSTTATLLGSVQDPSGAVIAGAQVIANNVDTNVEHRGVSEKNGEYSIGQLAPGNYTITVEAPGFSKLVQTGVALQVGQQSRLNLSLTIGQQTETIEVTGHPPLLETETSSVGTVVGERLVNQLPLNGRNFVQLATLSPGVTGVGTSATGTIQGGGRPDDKRAGSEIFANGNREGDNNYLIDGTDDNERLTLSLVLRPGVDAVREFRIQTSNYSADIGRNSGAVINVITKSGTNQLHGSVFEYIRNSAVDARSYFNRVPQAFPSFKLNQFGGSIGGPIVIPHVYNGKDKTFFFADYEGFRNSTQSFVNGTVPTVLMRSGDFSQVNPIYDPIVNPVTNLRTRFVNNFIPLNRRDPIAMTMINAYPLPTTSSVTQNYTSSALQTNTANQGDIRIDEQITAKDMLSARYSIQNTLNIAPPTYPNAVTLPGVSVPVHLSDEGAFSGSSSSPTQQFSASYTKIITSNIVNDFRVGFSRYRLDYVPLDFKPNGQLGNQLGILNSNVTPREQNLPIFSPANYLGVGQTRSLPLYRRENTFQELDNLIWTKGTHTFKLGIDFRRRQLTIYQTNQGNGRFNFSAALTDARGQIGGSTGDSMASFMLGYGTAITHDYTFQFPGIRLNEYGAYFADDWRASKKLTINYGLRWDYFSPPSEELDRWANFNPLTAKMDIAGRNGVGLTAGVQPFKKDFGPRLGFAYQLLDKTVIQGGVGLFFNASGSEAVNMRLNRNTPFGATISETPGDITPGTKVSDGFPTSQGFLGLNPGVNFASADAPTGSQSAVDTQFKPSYAEQFNLGVQQAVTRLDLVVKVTGVGNLGRRLYDAPNVNQPIPGPGSLNSRRPFNLINPPSSNSLSAVTMATSKGLAEYYALQVVVDKRLRQGVNALVGYAWSHAIDDVNLEFGGGAAGPSPQDPRFPRNDRSNSIIDQRQRLTLSYVVELPFGKGKRFLNQGGVVDKIVGGWQTNGILLTQTGLYFSPVLNTATTNTGSSSRPNQTGPVSYPKTLSKWFDPSAYVSPAIYTFGTSGRNSLIGPGRTNFDISVLKNIPVHDKMQFQFRFEAFNVFNHPQFNLPNATIGASTVGQITSIVGTPRNLQASLRFEF